MKKILLITAVVLSSSLFVSKSNAATTIGWAAAAGSFLSSTGAALTTGGVSIGFFTSAPADSAFGTTISDWASLISAGYTDVRSLPGTATGGLDWDYPLAGGGGSVTAVPFGPTTTSSVLAQNTQLYLFAFNGGSFNLLTPSSSFSGSTEWAVVKDNANLAPADLGTRNVVLTTVVGASEVLRGTDNGNNVNLTAIVAIPEPSRMMLLGFGLIGVFFRRRR